MLYLNNIFKNRHGFIVFFAAILLFSCNKNPKKTIQTSFKTENTAFQYFIDTTELSKETEKIFSKKFTPIGQKVKSITIYNYNVLFSNKQLEIEKDFIQLKKYNRSGFITDVYVKMEPNLLHEKYHYNSKNQLVKKTLTSKMDGQFYQSSIESYDYTKKKDSVVIRIDSFEGSSYGTPTYNTYAYDLKTNTIDSEFQKIKLSKQDIHYLKKFTRIRNDLGYFEITQKSYY